MDFEERKSHERRSTIRLEHIFPVEFRFLDGSGLPLSAWYQGFTQNVGAGGLCLTVNHMEFGDIKCLADSHVRLALRINIPLGKESVGATARLSWHETVQTEPEPQHVLGVCYETIDKAGNERILKYVRTRKLFKALAVTFTIFLSTALVITGFYNIRLRYENEKLLASVSENVAHQRALKQDSLALKKQIEEMEFLLSQSDRKMEMIQRRLELMRADEQKAKDALKSSLDFLKKYKERLKKDQADLIARKTKVDGDATISAQEASLINKKIHDKLYRWLVVHQNKDTGLVASFEGDRDVGDWAFTYDQALAAIAFTKAGDTESAARIFDFYLKAHKSDNGFFNVYYASSGEPAEYVVHTGPNIWLGLAILQYGQKTGDKRYLPMALKINRWLETIRDSEGGLRGGKEFSWYSTEHNLDAYAFYGMLARATGEKAYAQSQGQTLAWLEKNAYSKISAPMVKRGKGDATIATDTYAWSVTAIGPQTLKDIGMDPDAIMDFAVANCSVVSEYQRSDGDFVKVKGFDFAKAQNLGRGGVVSCEWSAQMILALKIMADYYRALGDKEKANTYASLSDEYTSELSKMITTSPSPVGQGDFCLPYASQEFADTGHGWRTPKGSRTGSVAATAYAILAIDGFNPLRLNET